MERQGSGFKKITETYRAAHNYRDELEPDVYKRQADICVSISETDAVSAFCSASYSASRLSNRSPVMRPTAKDS